MSLASLSILVLMAAAGEPDTAALVSQLGSARFADREEAARLLTEQGSQALPALRKANEAKDPEVRARAAVLLAKIEMELLVRPTMVRLDFRNATLAEVARGISDRSGMAVVLQGENQPVWNTRGLTLAEPEPVRFWDAIDRLARASGVEAMPTDGGPGGRKSGLMLTAGAAWTPGPRSDSGPFRTYLTNVRYSVDINLGGPVIGSRAAVDVMPPPVPAGRGFVVAPPLGARSRMGSNEQFDAMLQIQAEPRMMVAANGPPKLIEALDDKNQSLIPPTAGGQAMGRPFGGMIVQTFANSSVISTTAALRRPDQPGRIIRSLKGTIPVTVSTRKDGPTVVLLADAKGKSTRVGDQVLTVVDLRTDRPNNRHFLEVGLRNEVQAPNGEPGEMAARVVVVPSHSQFEVVDAQDRIYTQWFVQQSRTGPDETRMTLNMMQQDGVGPPAKLRFYQLSRASTEVSFDFKNLEVRMP